MNMAAPIMENLECYLGQADVKARMPDPVTDWVMIIVRPGMEQEARDSLRRRGVGAWWPNYQKEEGAKDAQSGKRYKRIVRCGVLPGVVLSPARLDQRFWAVCDLAPGIVNVAMSVSQGPIRLTEVDIALIHAIEAGLNKPMPLASAHSYKPGEMVRFVDDEYRRLPAGKVIKCSRDGHVTVEVNFFGRMTPMEVFPWQIEPVVEAPKNQIASRPTDARDRPVKSPTRR